MSATKIAANFRVSLTALLPRSPDRRVAVAWAWLHVHAALIEDAADRGAAPAFGSEPSRASESVRQFYTEGNIIERARRGMMNPA